MSKLFQILSDKPLIGAGTSLVSSALATLTDMIPALQVIGVLFGLIIGFLTIVSVSISIFIKRRENRCKELEREFLELQIKHQIRINEKDN